MRIATFFYVVLLMLLTTLTCQATYITYDNEIDFLNATGLTEFESFESLPPSDTATDFLTNINTPNFSANTSEQFMQIWGDPPVSFAPDGTQLLFWYALTQGTIEFSDLNTETYSFGVYITDWANYVDPGKEAELIFNNNIGDTYTISSTTSGLGDYNDIFFGFVSDDPFTSVSITTTNNDGWVFFDKVYTGQTKPVPEPATFFLLGFGLIGIIGLRRKKYRETKNTDRSL